MPTTDFQVTGSNANALFTLKVHRGDGMALLAMNWKKPRPPKDFVGFSIEYKEPGGAKFYPLMNRLSFADANGKVTHGNTSSLEAPFQKFRWVHFPRNAEMTGEFVYKVKPVFMNSVGERSYGESQQAAIELRRETYPGKLNVAFTRGFVSSQAFVDKYGANGGIKSLLPSKAKLGLDFRPTHPKAKEALTWMGFEAADAILKILDEAIADRSAQVRVIAYDLSHPAVVERLEKLGDRLKIIIDDSAEHGHTDSAETKAAKRLKKSTKNGVKRHHMSQLQHNKTIVVDGRKAKAVLCGSTNFTWRGFYVQANNAVVIRGSSAVKVFVDAFDNFWLHDNAKSFGETSSAQWTKISVSGIDAKVSFSPHVASNALLNTIAKDIEENTQSSLFYSLAFLAQTSGSIRNVITKLTKANKLFVYGISDKKVGGLELQKPDGHVAPVYPSEITKDLPEPFKSEPVGGGGTRMHHKFVVIDFDKPSARVYLGSYNFSPTADTKNGENLVLIKDRRVAVSYMIEALRIFDHYHFRVALKEAKKGKKTLALRRPPMPGEKAWWDEYYTDKRKVRDRELFA